MPFQSGVAAKVCLFLLPLHNLINNIMSSEIRQLQPQQLWNKFADLNEVPRPSKKEERVIAFMKDFGKNLDLETIEDAVGNVIINCYRIILFSP